MEFLEEQDRASSDDEASERFKNTRGDKLLSYRDGFANSSDRAESICTSPINKLSNNHENSEVKFKSEDRSPKHDLSVAAASPKNLPLQKSKQIRKKYKRREPKLAKNCAHIDAKAYALGMCKNCYHSRGRTKLATDCEHLDRKMYAHNVCKGCYLKIFQRRNHKN